MARENFECRMETKHSLFASERIKEAMRILPSAPSPPFQHSHSYVKATVRIKHRRTIKKSHHAFIFACSGPFASLFLRHSALLYSVFSLCGPCGLMLLVSECFTFFTAVDCTQALGRLDTCVWFGSCTSCALPWMHIIINMLLLARLMLSVVSACVPWPILEGFVNEQRSLTNIVQWGWWPNPVGGLDKCI